MRILLFLTLSFFMAVGVNAQGLQVQPLSQATKGAPPELVNVKSKSAGLKFISSIPLACTVVFGKTEQFGMMANDPDMGSLTTIDHNPVLGGLEPDTKYFFRVQGTAADGTLYAAKRVVLLLRQTRWPSRIDGVVCHHSNRQQQLRQWRK